jgi:hypothetical protein
MTRKACLIGACPPFLKAGVLESKSRIATRAIEDLHKLYLLKAGEKRRSSHYVRIAVGLCGAPPCNNASESEQAASAFVSLPCQEAAADVRARHRAS